MENQEYKVSENVRNRSFFQAPFVNIYLASGYVLIVPVWSKVNHITSWILVIPLGLSVIGSLRSYEEVKTSVTNIIFWLLVLITSIAWGYVRKVLRINHLRNLSIGEISQAKGWGAKNEDIIFEYDNTNGKVDLGGKDFIFRKKEALVLQKMIK